MITGNKLVNGGNGGKVNGNGHLREDFTHGSLEEQKYTAEKLKW